MNECYSGPTEGSAVQTRGKPPANPGQPSSSGLPHQNTAKIQKDVAPSPPPKHADAQDSGDTTKGARVPYLEGGGVGIHLSGIPYLASPGPAQHPTPVTRTSTGRTCTFKHFMPTSGPCRRNLLRRPNMARWPAENSSSVLDTKAESGDEMQP
jgi:hypothetical protein